jgi:phosphatidate cytidylyltransferase
VTDRDDDRTTPEGVRILGAEEARAALRGSDREPADEPREELVAEARVTDDDPARPARFADEGPSWSASDHGLAPSERPDPGAVEPGTGEVAPLPHWTEPPTGAVPAIFADDAEPASDEDLDAWASLSGGQPRFRAEGADWADADYAAGDLTDASTRLGALAERAEPALDDDAAFAAQVAARRAPRARPEPARRPRRAPADDVLPDAAGGRDLPTALATAAIVVVLALVSFSWGEGATAWLAAAVAGLASIELCFELRRQGLHTATPLVLVASVGLVVAAYEFGPAAYPVIGAVTAVSTLLWFLWRVTPGRPVVGVATTVFAFAYVGGLAGFAGLMLQSPDGVGLVLGMVLCVVASDVFGFFVGSQFGKSPVAPLVSPHKTIEGTVASVLGAMVVGWLLAGSIHPWDRTSGLALGALVAAGALLGDLSESMLKRDLGIKDFGATLPGHGGALDRFDALLFCLPIAYYLALHLGYV